jgi:hypothetical protein
MGVLTTKEEVIGFYEDEKYWPDTEASYICVEGEEILYGDGFSEVGEFEFTFLQSLPAGTKIKINEGTVWDEHGDFSTDFVDYFKRWRREHAKKDEVTILVKCDKSNEDAVRAAIESAGGKVTV